MSRIKTFVDFNNKQADDVVEILDQVGISVSVYRQQNQSGTPGFTTEVVAPTFLRNILAYLQPDRVGHDLEVRSEVGRGTELHYVAITQDQDVQPNDVWKHKGKEYHVYSIDNTPVGQVTVKLYRHL